MELTNSKDIRELLGRHGFRFSKSMGQNFLTAAWVPERIADSALLDENTGVLEVGPGIGCLTEQLSRRAGKVLAVELDKALKPVLAETLRDCGNVELIFGDVLKQDLRALCAGHFGGLRPVVCANLPYNVTSPLLTAFIEAGCFESITVMIQREVARRICAAPGSGDYGAFGVFVQWHTETELLFDVPPSCFIPQPKVTSAVLRLNVRTEPVCEITSEKMFFRVVKAAFAQRRKTLLNALSSGLGELSKEALSELLTGCGLAPSVRGETLDIPAFARIANALSTRAEA